MKPRFKKGDRVRALVSSGGAYTKGSLYEVREVVGDRILTSIDDKGSTTNGWCVEFFELVAASPTPAPKLHRLELQAAPQGGFLVVAPSASMGSMSETLSAHSEIGDALEFMRRAMV